MFLDSEDDVEMSCEPAGNCWFEDGNPRGMFWSGGGHGVCLVETPGGAVFNAVDDLDMFRLIPSEVE